MALGMPFLDNGFSFSELMSSACAGQGSAGIFVLVGHKTPAARDPSLVAKPHPKEILVRNPPCNSHSKKCLKYIYIHTYICQFRYFPYLYLFVLIYSFLHLCILHVYICIYIYIYVSGR